MLCEILGREAFTHFLIDFQVFVEADSKSFIQVAGLSIGSYYQGSFKSSKIDRRLMTDCLLLLACNQPERNIRNVAEQVESVQQLKQKNLTEFVSTYPEIQRSQIYYCDHIGRDSGVFRLSKRSIDQPAFEYIKCDSPSFLPSLLEGFLNFSDERKLH